MGVVAKVLNSLVKMCSYEKQSLELYTRVFQTPFLEATATFYQRETAECLSHADSSTYLRKALTRLEEEALRARKFLHPVSLEQLRDCCVKVMVESKRVTLESEATVVIPPSPLFFYLLNDMNGHAIASSCSASLFHSLSSPIPTLLPFSLPLSLLLFFSILSSRCSGMAWSCKLLLSTGSDSPYLTRFFCTIHLICYVCLDRVLSRGCRWTICKGSIRCCPVLRTDSAWYLLCWSDIS